MAYVVATKNGRFELRESRSTPAGPRSRTLASFVELDAKAIEKAIARAEGPLDRKQLRRLALRAGAPVAPREIDAGAQTMLRLLARGEQPEPRLRRLLLDALGARSGGSETAEPSAAARSAAEWIGVDAAERGEALGELLALGDALPVQIRPPEPDFPRLRST